MSGRLAVMFPGQGSQHVGMGAELAAAEPGVRELYEEADDTLGFALGRLCREGPEDELVQTQNAQPAILVHGYAVWTTLPVELRDAAVVGAGHSLGEFTAWLAAGALGFTDALRLVRRRGELMAAAGDERAGTMAAVLGLEPQVVDELCAAVGTGTVVPANYNAPGQIVVSGDVAAVEFVCASALEAGARRAVPLNVSGAFHSPLVSSARDGLAEALAEVEMADPAFPVVANATARAVDAGSEGRALLVEQLTSPVRWVDSMKTMADFDPGLWLEPGPGSVLRGLLRRIDRTWTAMSASGPREIDDLVEAFHAA